MISDEAISVACAIADEHIEWWRLQVNRRPGVHWSRRWNRCAAHEAWAALQPHVAYPGGGWERVRAEMVRWLCELPRDGPMQLAA